jgi:ADP-ribose pyrophosphatase YjhB (NUDIX family)
VSRRIDYFDSPDAPAATSIVPSANVVVVNETGEILLIHRTDNDNWALPGGAMDLGESLTGTAVRETAEETGVEIAVTGLVGIFTDRQEFSVVYTARPVGGELTPSAESSEVHWVEPAAIGSLTMDRSMRMRIDRYLAGNGTPHLG